MPNILKRAEKDAERIRKKARAVIDISDEGPRFIWNNEPDINVIALIGKTPETDGRQVVLEEIGLGRTRPFSEGKLPLDKRNGSRVRYIAPRTDIFYPTPKQYELVAPPIFSFLQKIVDWQTAQWKRGPHNPIYLWSPHNTYSQKGKKLYSGARARFWPRGLRFSVRSTSRLFLSDLYWAELNLNKSLRFHLEGLAKFIDLRLAKYKREWKGRVEFQYLKGVREIRTILEEKNLPKYLLAETLTNYLPGKQKNEFWQHLANLFGLNGEECDEKKISQAVLPCPKTRLGNIQLRIITGVAEAKRHAVFEIFPNGNENP